MAAPVRSDLVEHVSYDAGFIVLSYFVSLIGCITTLQLLYRRTSTKGLDNWLLLIASCITMGGSGIWAMHFIGNRAIVLNEGDPERQISYSPGFTALSFFLPILVLLIAFHFLASTTHAKPLYIILAGILAGTAICGMHYLGDYGIANYSCHYQIAYVVGAAIIAVVASLVALSVFFRLREAWNDTWWKRSLCAAVLASAVAGMHWTAAVGTEYRFKNVRSGPKNATRVQTVIVCAVLSVSTCVTFLAILLVRSRKLRITKNRAQQVVLACAYFDQDGKLMLTRDGTIPCEKITNRFLEKTFGEDELDRSHPTFTWVFKASRNWAAIKDIIPGMVENLSADPAARKYTPLNAVPVTGDNASDLSANFGFIFKQLFCVAAQRLASNLHEPLENLGPLFEEPLETGALHLSGSSREVAKKPRVSIGSKQTDLERDSTESLTFGRGKYLFLGRHLSQSDVDKFAAAGYRFGSTQQTSDLLARKMEVPQEQMKSRLDRMKLFSTIEHLPPAGVHLACFVLRPSVHQSFDVLVPAKTQNHLPLATMQRESLTEWQSQVLDRFDEWKVKDISRTLANEFGHAELEREFRWQLHSSLLHLLEAVGEFDNLMDAKFSAKRFSAPCRVASAPDASETCTLLTIRLINAIHTRSQNTDMTYIPLSFFSTQQEVESLDADHQAFVRRLKMEFGYRPPKLTDSRASPRNSHSASLYDLRHHRLHDSVVSTPSSLFRFKSAMRLSTARKSEESSIVRVRDVSVGASEEKSVSEMDDLETTNGVSTPVARTLTDPEFERGQQRGMSRDKNGGQSGIEMVAVTAGENANWVSDLFALFGLGLRLGARG